MDIQIVGKHIKRCCQPLVVREIKTSDKDSTFKMLEDYGTSTENCPTLVVEFKLVNLENCWVLFTSFEHTPPYDPTITLLVCTQQKCGQGPRTRLLTQHLSPQLETMPKPTIGRTNHLWYVHAITILKQRTRTVSTGKNFTNDSEQKADAKEYVLRFMCVR